MEDIIVDESPVDLFSVPSLVKKPTITNDDMVYSSLLTEGDPVENYKQIKEESNRTGTSKVVEDNISQWQQEQKDLHQSDVEDILSDPNVDPKVRQQVATQYVMGGLSLSDLREKYLIKQAAIDTAFTELDREAQDIYASTVLDRDKLTKEKTKIDLISQGAYSFTEDLKNALSPYKFGYKLFSDIVYSIPAGLMGIYELAKTQNPEEATKAIESMMSNSYAPADLRTQRMVETFSTLLEKLNTPFRAIGDFVNTAPYAYINPKTNTVEVGGGDQPGFAALTEIGLQTLVPTAIFNRTGALMERAIRKGKTTVDPVSPLATTETASKETAAKMAASALADKTETITSGLRTNKAAILNDYVLPKLSEEFGPIRPDVRKTLEEVDKELFKLYDDTELHPHIAPVSQIVKERDLYVKVITETTEPHLLLSSSVLGTTGKAFGRSGKGYEALIDTNYNTLEGTAVYGRNAHHGYKTQKGAEAYLEKLKEQTSHLPHVEDKATRPDLKIIERDGEFFVGMDFKRTYNQWEHLAFGADALSAHVVHPRFDATWFANTAIGDKIWPAYMRMREDIPSVGYTTALKEAKIEGGFINAQRELVLGTKKPKDLVAMVRRGEEEGKVYSSNDFQTINQHLTKAENDQLFAEYVGFRRIQDHLYRFADRKYRAKLNKEKTKNLYDKDGNHLGLVSEPIKDLTDIKKVWDIDNKQMVETSSLPIDSRIVTLKSPVRNGDHLLRHAVLSPTHQFGEIRAGALTKIPGYVGRHYKEWFVLDKKPSTLYVDGVKQTDDQLRNYSQAVAMGGTRKEIETLLSRFQKEDPNNTYIIRKEEKRIEDSIIHDSEVYDTYLKEHHQRGERLPALNREADIEDILVSQTRAIQGVAKVTAWDDLNEVNRTNFVKAYGKFTEHKFPKDITKIQPLSHMDEVLEREFLAAQKIFQQWEMQQISQMPSDILWKTTLNKVSDIFEKMDIPAPILREWGEKGFVPIRAAKALGSNLFLYANPLRMWFIQPQQWKELSTMSPSFIPTLRDIAPIMLGVLARSHTFKPLRSQADIMGRRVVTKDYDEIVQTLVDSGIVQAVDMNQMIHGFWRDSLKELDPKAKGALSKTIEVAGTAVKTPFKMGRSIGYDPAELTNQITLWLFAKHRWEEKNPGKNWKLPENKEAIMQLQGRLGHMASTRAGMYSWQDGTISLITQFAAIPFKSTMQMISAKEFTTGEKARLAGARMLWYGKYGIPGGAAVYKTIESVMDNPEDKETIGKYSEGATAIIHDAVLGAMFDASGEKTSLASGKSFSTVPESIWFYDMGEMLFDVAQGEAPDKGHKFPFISAGSNTYTMVRDMYDLFTLPPKIGTERETTEMLWKAVSFAGSLSAYSKSQVIEQSTKGGTSLGYQQTRGEAIARLVGIQPTSEIALWEGLKDETKREKSIKEDAKIIHQRLIAFVKNKDLSKKEEQDLYIKGMQAFLGSVDTPYAEKMVKAILQEDKNRHKNLHDSLMLYFYQNSSNKNDAYMIDMENSLGHVNSPEMQSLLKDLKERRNK